MRRGGIPTALKLAALVALTIAAVLTPRPGPAQASGVRAIAVGGLHTCALMPDSTVTCWGYNAFGQVGDGTFAERRTTPVDVLDAPGGSPLDGVAAVAAGNNHTCALTAAGGVKCWGFNYYGQLGDGRTTDLQGGTAIAADVLEAPGGGPLTGVAAIGAGANHTCALTTEATVKCWGNNEDGRLGDGTRGDGISGTLDNIRTTPVDVCQDYDEAAEECTALLSGVVAIAAGSFHTCALMTAGTAKCWGNNIGGQLGDGTGFGSLLDPIIRTTPVDVCQDYEEAAEQCTEVLSGIAAVGAGEFHSCAVTVAGGLKCWGASFYGQLGDGWVCANDWLICTMPVDVCADAECTAPLSGVVSVAPAASQTCALITVGAVKCWGWNNEGALGDGGRCGSACFTPVDVWRLSGGVAAVGASRSGVIGAHTCVLTIAGGVKCWGENFFGQLGIETCCGDRTTPQDVVGLGPKPAPTPTPTATQTPAAPAGTPTATEATPSPPAASPTELISVVLPVILPQTGAAGPSGGGAALWVAAALAGAGAMAVGSAALRRLA